MPKSDSENMRSSGGAPSEYSRPFVVAWLSHEYCQCAPPSSLNTRPKFAATMICVRAIGRQQHGLRVREGAVGARASVARRSEQEERTGDERARRHG